VTVYDPRRAGLACAVSRSCFAIPGGEGAAGRYVVPVRWAQDIGARLALHGIACERCARERGLRVEAFRATHVRFAAAPFEAVCA